MSRENWKDIKGYEGLYQVSTLGRVKSMDMKIDFYPIDRKPYTQIRKGRILKEEARPLSPRANLKATPFLTKSISVNFAL